MRPGRPASGTFRLTNQTGRTIEVLLRPDSSSSRPEALVHLRLSARGGELSNTTIEGLPRVLIAPVALRPGQSTELRAAAWIERGADTGNAGGVASVVLEPVARPEPRR